MFPGRRAVLVSLATATLLFVPGRRVDAQVAASARDSVLAVVQEFFRAMEAKDTAQLRTLMLADGHTVAVVIRNDSTAVRTRINPEFPGQLMRSPEPWRERIWEPQVLIHQSMAVLWAPYDFYQGSTFSHCGVDSFTLVRLAGGWKIVDAAFTIEPVGCAPSPLGPRTR